MSTRAGAGEAQREAADPTKGNASRPALAAAGNEAPWPLAPAKSEPTAVGLNRNRAIDHERSTAADVVHTPGADDTGAAKRRCEPLQPISPSCQIEPLNELERKRGNAKPDAPAAR